MKRQVLKSSSVTTYFADFFGRHAKVVKAPFIPQEMEEREGLGVRKYENRSEDVGKNNKGEGYSYTEK